MRLKLKVETIDWLLFNLPEFAAKARQNELESRGIVEFLPRSNRPGSPVERIVFAKSIMQQVYETLMGAYNSLDEYCRAIAETKYGFHVEGAAVKPLPPHRTQETYSLLCQRNMNYSEAKFYEDLRKIREVVGSYGASLGASLLGQVSGMMPRTRRIRKVTDEEFEKIKSHLEIGLA